METPVILGLGWGLLAAAVQFFHLERSIFAALRLEGADPSKRMSKTLIGSLARLLALTVLFLIAWKSDWIRLDVSVVAFAVFHLIFMFVLGFNLKSRLSPPDGP